MLQQFKSYHLSCSISKADWYHQPGVSFAQHTSLLLGGKRKISKAEPYAAPDNTKKIA